MPTIIDRYVRDGKVKVITRPIAFIGADSERRAARGALGRAAEQARAVQPAHLLQPGRRRTRGWLTDDLVAAAYASIPGLDVQEALSSRNSPTVLAQTQAFDQQANDDKRPRDADGAGRQDGRAS